MDKELVAAAFNEWMRRFTETPERFSREFQDVQKFLEESAEGRAPTYGEECAAYLESIMSELAQAAEAPTT